MTGKFPLESDLTFRFFQWFNGEIRKVVTDAQGRATVVAEVPGLKLRDLIGRSVVLHDTSTNSR